MVTQDSTKNEIIPFFSWTQLLLSSDIKHTDILSKCLQQFNNALLLQAIFRRVQSKTLLQQFDILQVILQIFSLILIETLTIGNNQAERIVVQKLSHRIVLMIAPLKQVRLHMFNYKKSLVWNWLHSTIIINELMIRLCRSFKRFYSIFKDFPQQQTNLLPKSSRFSDFMGLTLQLQKLREQQIKSEKKEVKNNSAVIAVCFGLIGVFILSLYINKKASKIVKLHIQNFKTNLCFTSKQKQKNCQDVYQLLIQFNKENEYHRDQTLSFIKNLYDNRKYFKQYKIKHLIEDYMKYNNQWSSSPIMINICHNTIEDAIQQSKPGYAQIAISLAQKGNLKDIYLSLKYIEKVQSHNRLKILLKDRKQLIRKNYNQKKQEILKYYQKIEKISEVRLQFMEWKQQILKKWQDNVLEILSKYL